VDVLPVLTGFWQVNGKNSTTFKEMIVLDLFYVRNMSIWLDLRIIFKTIPTLLREISKVVGRVRNRLIQRPALAEVRLARNPTRPIS
jgi:lipopolysaccharide/colanic/teichoic acid biosynthesis glycosyltransferase